MKIIECNDNVERETVTETIREQICQRHQTVFGKENQTRISDLTIGVVSTGGLGSIIIEQLMRLFPGRLIYVDKDYVELSNLNRLVGATKIDARLRTSKVDVTSRNILSFNPDQQIVSIFGDFLDQEHQERFKECDFVIGASDSNAVRIAGNNLCLAHGIPYLDCGVGAVICDGRLKAAGGQVIKVLPDSGFCLQCGELFNVPEAMKEFLPESERSRLEDQGYIRGEQVDAPQVYSLNMMVASWAVWAFMRIVSGETPQFDGIAIDARDFRAYTWREKTGNNRDCPTCGQHGIIFSGDDADLLTRELTDLEIDLPVVSSPNIESKDAAEGYNPKLDKEEMPLFYPRVILGDDTVHTFNLGLWI